VESWQCDDPIYRWAGRGAPSYSLMTSEDKDVLREEFRRAGRERFLPGVFS
jgi:fatty-acyl-CoA synthase